MSARTSAGPLPPGSTIGILGGGQLGRMTAVAAAELGYRCHIYDPVADGPASQVAASSTAAAWDDGEALERFADTVDVVMYEFENVPVETVDRLLDKVPVRPGSMVLQVAQSRVEEKSFARHCGLETAAFWGVRSLDDLEIWQSMFLCVFADQGRGNGYDTFPRWGHGAGRTSGAWSHADANRLLCLPCG